MMHHHTKFAYKMFRGSEDIIKTVHEILNHCCGLDLEHSNHTFPLDTLASDDVPVTTSTTILRLVVKGSAVQKI